MRVNGRVLDIEHKAGSFAAKDGSGQVNYDFTVIHLLDGREVVKVRLPNEVHPLDLPFKTGDDVTLDISVPEGTKARYVGVSELV